MSNFDKGSSFRRETISYLRESLSKTTGSDLSRISTNPIITCFKPVAEAISKSYSDRGFPRHTLGNDQTKTFLNILGQLQTFLDELLFFVKMCEEEQRLQMGSHVPTIEEYTSRRMGSSAVRVCLAISEYECYDAPFYEEPHSNACKIRF